MKNKLVLIIFSLVCCTLWCQEPVSIHLTQKDGLPDIEFYDIIEDNEGFIWLAADKGLFRYNGKEYKNYSHPNKRGLSIFNLLLDEKGRLWCNNLTGQIFFVENDSLKLFVDLRDKIKTTSLPVFLFDKEQNITIATDKGLFGVDRTTKEVESLFNKHRAVSRSNHEIKYANDQLYYVHDSLYVFKGDKVKKRIPIDAHFSYGRIFSLNDKNFYIRSTEKKFNSNVENNTDFRLIDENIGLLRKIETPKELKNKTIIRIDEIDDKAWISTNGGVFIYRLEDNDFILENKFLENNYVAKVLKDRNENYWIITVRNGVYLIHNLNITKLITPSFIRNVTTVDIINDHIIYGTDNGYLISHHLKTNESKVIKLKNKTRVFETAYNQEKNLLFICGDVNSYLWNLSTGKVSKIDVIKGAKDINTMHNNSVLLSYHSGTNMLDFSNYQSEGTIREKKFDDRFRIQKTSINPKKTEHISTVRGYTNHYSKDSSIYVGQIDKLFFIDKDLKKTEITLDGSSIFTTDITETDDQTIWVSTNEKGIMGIRNQRVVYNYTQSTGLISNEVLKIEADGNNLWFVTNKGLQFFDRDSDSFMSFSFYNEIPIQKVEDIKIHENKVYVAGNSGIFTIDKNYFQTSSYPPKVYFESIFVGNREAKKASDYCISYTESAFEAFFNTNIFNSKESITYLYRLEGLEEDWTPTNIGNVRFPSLPYGRYTFQVKAVTNKGVESDVVETIVIEVTKPFWYQWWFYLILLVLLFTYYKVTLTKIEKKQLIKLENERVSKQLVLSQLENLRSQMNPHFIFNVLNSIQEYIISNDKYAASLYLSEFSKLIRMYLEHSRKEEISLDEEVKALKIYLELEKNRFEEDFEYIISLNENIDKELVSVPSLFIQPYVENSIKHGLLHKAKEKKLSVNFVYDKTNNTLVCEITDNGIGRKESEKINQKKRKNHISFATKAIDNRVDLLNKNRERKIRVEIIDLDTQYHESKGTKITITIPQ